MPPAMARACCCCCWWLFSATRWRALTASRAAAAGLIELASPSAIACAIRDAAVAVVVKGKDDVVDPAAVAPFTTAGGVGRGPPRRRCELFEATDGVVSDDDRGADETLGRLAPRPGGVPTVIVDGPPVCVDVGEEEWRGRMMVAAVVVIIMSPRASPST